jgi:hypothetical protein
MPYYRAQRDIDKAVVVGRDLRRSRSDLRVEKAAEY